MKNDIFSLILLAFASSMSNEDWEDVKKKEREAEMRKNNCNKVILEPDMGKTVSFCKDTHEPCDLHCIYKQVIR